MIINEIHAKKIKDHSAVTIQKFSGGWEDRRVRFLGLPIGVVYENPYDHYWRFEWKDGDEFKGYSLTNIKQQICEQTLKAFSNTEIKE